MGHFSRPGVAAEFIQKLAEGRINLRGFSLPVIGTQFLAYAAVNSLKGADKIDQTFGEGLTHAVAFERQDVLPDNNSARTTAAGTSVQPCLIFQA